MRALSALCLALGALGTACFTTTVHSGLPPGDVASELDAAPHYGFLFGLVEASGPYDLGRACPAGWSEVETTTDPLDVVVSLVTVFIITPQKVTVVCAAPPSAPVLAPSYPPTRSSRHPPPPSAP